MATSTNISGDMVTATEKLVESVKDVLRHFPNDDSYLEKFNTDLRTMRNRLKEFEHTELIDLMCSVSSENHWRV